MTILHFSDTHLGYSDLDIVDEFGVNQREKDFYDAFISIVDDICTLKPDFVIHTGDLFDKSRPSNRALSIVSKSFERIEKLKIPFILIAGNHSTPKESKVLPILEIFDRFTNIHLAYTQEYKLFSFENICFHCVPHTNLENTQIDILKQCEKNINKKTKNIMLLHCSVGSHYLMQEFGERVYPKDKEYLFEKMDYVALGHWHGFGSVGKYKNVYYSGSTERTRGDTRNEKGYVLVDLNKELKATFVKKDIRNIISIDIDAKNYDLELAKYKDYNIKDCILYIKIINLDFIEALSISNEDIYKIFKDAFYIHIKRDFMDMDKNMNMQEVQKASLQEHFIEFALEDIDELKGQKIESKIKELFSICYQEDKN